MFEPTTDATVAGPRLLGALRQQLLDGSFQVIFKPAMKASAVVTPATTTPPSAPRFPTLPMRATRLQAHEPLPCCHLKFQVMPSSSAVATSAF